MFQPIDGLQSIFLDFLSLPWTPETSTSDCQIRKYIISYNKYPGTITTIFKVFFTEFAFTGAISCLYAQTTMYDSNEVYIKVGIPLSGSPLVLKGYMVIFTPHPSKNSPYILIYQTTII